MRGKDVDWVIIPNRTDADPGAVGLACRAGLVNDFSQFDKLAIIDLRGTSNNEIHTDFPQPRASGTAGSGERPPQ